MARLRHRMTHKKLCQVIQCFPILLIIAQKKDFCINTPLIYKGPQSQVTYNVALQTLLTAMGQTSNTVAYHVPVNALGYPYHVPGIPLIPSYGHGYGTNGVGVSTASASASASASSNQLGFSSFFPGPVYHNSVYGNGFVYGRAANLSSPSYASEIPYGRRVHVGTWSKGSGYEGVTNKTSTKKVPRSTIGSNGTVEVNQCNTPDGNPGYCVGIRQCEELLRLIKEIPRNPSAKSFLQRSLCWYEGKDPVVCCARSYQTLPTAPPETMTEPTNPITQPKPETTSAPIVSTEEPLAPKDNPLDLPSPGECGVGAKFTRRVVGGVPAELGDYPWMAVLGYRSQRRPGEARWLCGGTLVSRSHVVTAAHCIDRHEDDLYLVRLGELNLERDDDGASPVDAPIARMSKHPEYSPKMYTNDIGLLTLAQIITFNSLLSPICLPTDPMIRTRDFVDYNPFLAGWGDTQFRGPQSPQLQVVQLPVVSNERCRNAYASFKRQVIDERVLCAGYAQGGRDACQGDSGGPLMQPVQSRTGNRTSYFYLIGVVSYGHKCAEPGFPGVYTRVTHFIPWLEQEMSKD